MLTDFELRAMQRYRRTVDYLAAAQIYLRDNVLLREPLRREHIKPRLLGHWGTAPGINLIYTHLNRIARTTSARILLVTGPGHGAAANLANLFLEGTLEQFYPERYPRTHEGVTRLVRDFSWPGGFPSHLVPAVPGVLHEGGELGYALSKAFGIVLDRPNTIAACIVGDGEAETGPTATAWHGTKFLDPQSSGAVLPILHINGTKISGPTLFGTLDDRELDLLFRGYGWIPRIVEGAAIDRSMADAIDWAFASIATLQTNARAGRRDPRPAWPLLLLRTPKGMGCPKEWKGALEGTWRTHQVPIQACESTEALAAVEGWLRSYRPEELFEASGRPCEDILATCPQGDRRLGLHPDAYTEASPLPKLPLETYAVEARPIDGSKASALATSGLYLRDLLRATEQERSFRIVCPDEMTSNRLGAVFEATGRAYEWPIQPLQREKARIEPNGRVMEMLSEHMCQGWLEGYVLTGRHGIYPCYEAFIPIVDGMLNQYAKFIKQKREIPWRPPIASLNYLLTSDGWRQDHNGYSHQGPGFINTLLDKKGEIIRIYLPPDANSLLVVLEHALASREYINLILATKNEMPSWLSLAEARTHAEQGASIWKWASQPGSTCDVVLACCGATPTLEALAAVSIAKKEAPWLRVQLVNVVDLLVLDGSGKHPHAIDDPVFEELFPVGKQVIFAFHGYPSAVRSLLFRRRNSDRFHIFGYEEEGTTTTPFDMTIRNGISRYQLLQSLLRAVPRAEHPALCNRLDEKIIAHRLYIEQNGIDPDEIAQWKWG